MFILKQNCIPYSSPRTLLNAWYVCRPTTTSRQFDVEFGPLLYITCEINLCYSRPSYVHFINVIYYSRGSPWKSVLVICKQIFTNKKRDLSVCLSGYTFRHALRSHADILDIDRGHIFRKHRHKNNKNVAVIYEKMVKKRPLLSGFLQAGCYGVGTFIAKF